MYEYFQKNKQLLQNALILCGTILICFLFLRYLFPILLPFVFGWILSLCFRPLVNRLEKYHVPRFLGTLLCIVALFAAFGLFGVLIGNRIVAQARTFYEQLPYYMDKLEIAIYTVWAKIETILVTLPPSIQENIYHIQQNISSMALSLAKSTGSASLNVVPNFFIGLLMALFSCYFFTKDEKWIHTFYVCHIQPLLGNGIQNTKQELKRSFWGYIKTQLILMVYVFIITIISMLILQSPFALLLSILIAIIDALPFFGSGFILWPGAVIHLLLGDVKLAIGYMIIYVLVQILRQIMQPKILSTQIGLHPLVTLFSMYFGFRCIGFWGLILGPVIAVLLQAYFQTQQQTINE